MTSVASMNFTRQIARTSTVKKDGRLLQAQGIFELPPAAKSVVSWDLDFELPAAWNVGAIVGESGSGKTTIARELAAMIGGRVVEAKDADGNLREPFEWDRARAVVSHTDLPIAEWTGLLSRVGFSSPPAWCRPYQVLSNGQQFRVNLARGIAEAGEKPMFFDEFASLVHDGVAGVASAAVSKAIRSMGRQFVAVTWRQDILAALEPDWVLFVSSDGTARLELNTISTEAGAAGRSVRRWSRPPIKLKIVRCAREAWDRFRGHHYLSSNLHRSAKCFLGLVDGEPAVFTAVLPFPHPTAPSWREHRTVCLPDFQGVGIGNAMSEFIASLFSATGKPFTSTTSHPAMIRHRLRSPRWHCHRKPGMVSPSGKRSAGERDPGLGATLSIDRITAGFRYIGPPADPKLASAFGLSCGTLPE